MIKNLKYHYRKFLPQLVVSRIDSHKQPASEIIEEVTMPKAINLIQQACKSVKDETINVLKNVAFKLVY